MNKLLVLSTALILSACANTWQGVKEDTAIHWENSAEARQQLGEAAETGWDKTKGAAKKAGQAVGRGMSKTGEYLEEISR